jgi:hypothetical protein
VNASEPTAPGLRPQAHRLQLVLGDALVLEPVDLADSGVLVCLDAPERVARLIDDFVHTTTPAIRVTPPRPSERAE